ncbi:LPD7 domain-containing protein [Vibrio tubiashii]|uniref:Relaxase n=1 Tax=Vibrio tubiashii ATCC 19109 TaxID=1051646 RepID=F9T6S3_9VIBR|nr:LPD7 domain-containing protein [Vibrio tubiashii]AIW17487.1 relaxase [Vibrio tubiashii ATCC 19109]EGU54478.1 relaxase NikB [Vibrio tubiashii ATCC 19109]EIF05999.1 relaxase NikB [Vibrio tubiashii NCIMB 1337 = ATCC 19106]
MLARVSSNKLGIVDYLKNGHKSGRSLSRDELDERVCIDGDLNLTEELINQLNIQGREDNYLHITLSYAERDLSEDKIIDSYNQYKKLLMSAYGEDEYNVYAEIHHPKVKSYVDKKTGEVVERFPHVHMVIPKRNMITGKSINPFGRYTDNIKYHDAIQETVNRTHQLESPYDNQRKYRILGDDSDFISRYKGDTFKSGNREFKEKLFDSINAKEIRTMKAFEKELASHGQVSKGKAGAVDEYYQIKLPGQTKNIRLKHTCFTKDYIEKRELQRVKPSDKKIAGDLSEWLETRSEENKFIHPASPRIRKEYYKLNQAERTKRLLELKASYEDAHKINDSSSPKYRRATKSATTDIPGMNELDSSMDDVASWQKNGTHPPVFDSETTKTAERTDNHSVVNQQPAASTFATLKTLEPSASSERLNTKTTPNQKSQEETNNVNNEAQRREIRSQPSVTEHRGERRRQPTEARNGLPSMQPRNVDGSRQGRGKTGSGVLPTDKYNRVGWAGQYRDRQLRRSNDVRRRLEQGFKQGVKEGIPGVRKNVQRRLEKPTSLIEQYKQGTYKTPQSELDYFRKIRRDIDPEALLNHFEKSHGLIKRNYSIEAREDGTPRIRIGNRAYTASDFCTKHMHLEWDETKHLLTKLYQDKLAKRDEQHELNAIVFASDYTTQGYSSKSKLSRVNESLQIFKYLQQKEQYEDRKMSLSEAELKHRTDNPTANENAISNDELSYQNITDTFLRQQQLAQSLTVKLSDIVASKDLKDKYVDFSDKNTGIKLFRDHGHKIVMNSRNPDVNHVAAAMALASEKFGTVNITGSKDFKQQVIDVAVAKDLNIVFANKQLQQQFMKCKQLAKENALLEQASKKHDTKNAQSVAQSAVNIETGSTGGLAENRSAAAIREALTNSDKVKSDLEKLEGLDDVQKGKVVSSHVDMLQAHQGTAGYRIVEDAMLSGAENNEDYQTLVDKEIEVRKEQQTKAEAEKQVSASSETAIDGSDKPLVTLVGHGAAPYLNKKDGKLSYYVELSNGEVKWGVGLKEAITKSKAKVGDVVEVERVGKKDVQLTQLQRDNEGKVTGTDVIDTHRNKWEVTVVGRTLESAPIEHEATQSNTPAVDEAVNQEPPVASKQQTDSYAVDYEHQEGTSLLRVTINGQEPSTVETKVLLAIQQQDGFLKNFTLAQIESGELQQRQAKGAQPVPQTYGLTGEVVNQDEKQTNVPKLK